MIAKADRALPPFGRDVMYTYFRYGEDARYETAQFLDVPGGEGLVDWARSLAGRAKLHGLYFVFPGGIPQSVRPALLEAFDRAAGPDSPPLWDHVLTGDIEEARGLWRRYEELSRPSPEPAADGPALPGGNPEPPVLTKRLGQGRNVVVVSGLEGGGFSVSYGLWSAAKKRVLAADEEVAARKCRFREANPGATHMQKSVFAEAVRPICGSLSVPGGEGALDALCAVAARLAGKHDALVLAEPSAGPDAVSALSAALGPGRVFRPPA